MAEWIINLFSVTDAKLADQISFLVNNIPFAIWETFYSTALATLCAYIIGLPLGVILVTGAQEGIRPLPRALMQVLNVVVNLLRSVPFLILMVLVMPLSRIILGTTIGTPGILVPLTVAAAPFVARLVESSLREMDRGVIEAAQSMGCSTWQIVTKVLLPEALPALVDGITLTVINLIGYSAMAGAIGGGGLGDLAIRYGYQRFRTEMMVVAVVVIIVLVECIQFVGTRISAHMMSRR